MSDVPQHILDQVERDRQAAQPPAHILEQVQKDRASASPIPQSAPPSAPPMHIIQQVQKDRDAAKQVYEGEPTQESLATRSTRRAGQELYSTLGAPQMLYGLAGAALEAAFSDDIDFKEAMLSDEGRALVARASAGDQEAAAQIKADPTAIMRSGIRGAAEWYNEGGELFGVTNNPDGSVPLDEEVGGIVLSSLITAPASLISKPLTLANKITNRAARMAVRGAIRGAELATPVTIGGPKMMAANMAVQTGINDAMRAVMDEPTLVGQVIGADEAGAGSVTPVSGLPVEDTPMQDAGLLAGAAGAAILGLSAGRLANRIGGRAGRQAIQQGTPQLGELPARNIGEHVTDAANFLGNEQGITVEAVKRINGQKAADNFNDVLTANSGQSVNASFNRFKEQGIISPEGNIRAVPLDALDANYAKLTPDEKDIFDKGMLALDELRRRSEGTATMGGIDRRSLQLMADRARNNPNVRRHIEMYSDIGDGFSRARRQAGMISPSQRAKEAANKFDASRVITTAQGRFGHGGYVPFKAVREEPGFLRRAKMMYEGGTSTGTIRVSPIDEAASSGGVGTTPRMKPMEAIHEMAEQEIAAMAHNHVRRAFARAVADAPVQSFPQGRKVVARGDKGVGTKMEVFEDGQKVSYMIGDKRIANALRFRPAAAIPIAAGLRRWFQRGTTGALNPLFAPMSLTYDAMFGMLAARNEKIVTGILDQKLAQAARKVGMSDNAALRMRQFLSGATRPAELTWTVLEGLFQGATGRYKMEVARHMMNRAAEAGTPTTAAAAAKATDTWLKSKYGMMHMSGHPAHNYIDAIDAGTGKLEKLVSKATSNKMARTYNHLLETVRDAYRMGVFSRNVAYEKSLKVGPLNADDYRRIARNTKDVASDPTKHTASKNLSRIMSATPYANVIMHSTAHLAKQINNPAAYSVLAAMVAARFAFVNGLSPEAREYVDKQMPDYQRFLFLPIEQERTEGEPFDPSKHLELIPLGPEMGVVTQVAMDLLGGMIDHEAQSNMDTSFTQRAIAGVGQLMEFPVPPVLNVGASLLGYGTLSPSAAVEGRPLFREGFQDAGMQEYRGTNMNAGLVNDWVYNAVHSALGTAGRTIMDFAEVMDSQMYLHDEGFFDAADDAMDVTWHNAVERQAIGTLFSDATTQLSISSPQGNRAYEIDRAMDDLVSVYRATMPTIDGDLDADIPLTDVINNMPRTVRNNPQLAKETGLVQAYFNTPYHKKQMEEITDLRQRIRRLKGDTQMSVEKRNTEINERIREMQKRYDNVLDNYAVFEDTMIRQTGDPSWSLQKLADRVEAYLRYN